MNKIIISYIAIATFTVIPAVVLAEELPPVGVDNGSSAALSTDTGGTSATPAVDGISNTSATPSTDGASFTTATPAVDSGGAVTSANPPAPSVGNTPNSSAGSAVVVTQTNPPANTGSTGGGSYFGGGSYSSGGSISNSSCPLISTTLKRGWNNNPVEVTKLQTFLKNTEKMNVNITGIFDENTENAVKAFQIKYAATILDPWGIKIPTGTVFITTLKKINQIACNQPLVLNAQELATISGYKSNIVAQPTVIVIPKNDTKTVVNLPVKVSKDITSEDNKEDSTNVGENNIPYDTTANAVNSTVAGRFWGFIVNLFK